MEERQSLRLDNEKQRNELRDKIVRATMEDFKELNTRIKLDTIAYSKNFRVAIKDFVDDMLNQIEAYEKNLLNKSDGLSKDFQKWCDSIQHLHL